MRILMLGTGPFAVPTFEWLLQSPQQVLGLVTRPVREAHSRDKHALNPMRDLAVARGLPIFEPENINDVATRAPLQALLADLLVVCDYGQILKPEVLALAPLGGINLHGSLLPKYRGAAPVQWCVYHGDAETGVTVIHMSPQLDAGPTLVQLRTPVGENETAAELEPRLAKLGVGAVAQALELLAEVQAGARREPPGIPQNGELATRAPRLKKSDGAIDWSRPAAQIRHQVRAFQPWPGSFTHWQRSGQAPLRLILEEVALAAGANSQIQNASEPMPAAGEVVRAAGGELLVATGDGFLSIVRVQPAGKRAMSAAEFLRGHSLQPGHRLG